MFVMVVRPSSRRESFRVRGSRRDSVRSRRSCWERKWGVMVAMGQVASWFFVRARSAVKVQPRSVPSHGVMTFGHTSLMWDAKSRRRRDSSQ